MPPKRKQAQKKGQEEIHIKKKRKTNDNEQDQNDEDLDKDYQLALKLSKEFEEKDKEQENQQQQQQKQKKKSNKQNNNSSEIDQEDEDFKLALKLSEELNKDNNQRAQVQKKQKSNNNNSRNQKQQRQQNNPEDEEEEKKEAVNQPPPRRSRRQLNKQTNYDIDSIIDQRMEEQDEEMAQWERPVLTDTQKKQNRIERAKKQRMYLLEAKRVSNDAWKFLVKGSQGKDYHLDINTEKLTCQCHDFRTRRKCCKHIFFIVSRIAQNENFLNSMKSNPKLNIEQYKILDQSLTKRLKERVEGNSQLNKSQKVDIKSLEDDKDCAICFDELTNEDIDQCTVCKKYIHQTCMEHWLKGHDNCPMCRSTWHVDDEKVEDAYKKLKNNNINL